MKKIIAVSFAALLSASASSAFAGDNGGQADRFNEARPFPNVTTASK